MKNGISVSRPKNLREKNRSNISPERPKSVTRYVLILLCLRKYEIRNKVYGINTKK
jgi:hypothetical protein